MTTATLRDLDGQRSIEIDARDKTVFIDAGNGGPCWEFDQALLIHALQKVFQLKATCGSCAVALALTA